MAIDSNMGDLQIVHQILPSEAMDMIEQHLSISHFSILARWAINSPEKLMQLYQDDIIILLERVRSQATAEHEAIYSERGDDLLDMGYSEWEVLSLMGVNSELS